MDLLSILLKISGLVLIIVFIDLGIKLINLTKVSTKVVTEVEKDIENYKNKISPFLKIIDYFNDITNKSNFLVERILKKLKLRKEN